MGVNASRKFEDTVITPFSGKTISASIYCKFEEKSRKGRHAF